MDAKGLQIDSDTFSCSICLDLLKDPVTIPCGHSYCMSCLDTHWTGEEDKKSYSCPQCRHLFPQRPALVKNPLLVILMEGLKKNVPPSAAVCPSAPCGDVYCDLCSGRKVRAVKSCLQCLVSYCKEHLQPHYDVPALKKHKLVEPTDHLQGNLCPRHDEVMKMFCRTDQQCICYLCSVDQHKDHHTVTAAAERAEKQRELQVFQKNILLRLDHRQKDVDLLQHQVKSSCDSFRAAEKLCDKSLIELAVLVDKKLREVKQRVRAQQEAEKQRVKELQDKVQQEITELKRKVTELDTLSHTEDHVTFLHNFASLSKISETSASVNSQSPPPFQDMVTSAVSKLRSALQEPSLTKPPAALHKPKVTPKKDVPPAGAQTTAPPPQPSSKDLLTILLPKLNQPPAPDPPLPQPAANRPPQRAARPANAQPRLSLKEWPSLPQRNLKPKISEEQKVQSSPPSPPPEKPHVQIPPRLAVVPHFKSTRELQEYVRDLTLDPKSLNNNLILSQENHVVAYVSHSQEYRPNPARFTHFPQVVSRQILTGRCSWMVGCSSDHTSFSVAVAYDNIRRDGDSDECCFGKNADSWALDCSSYYCTFWHNGTSISIRKQLGKIVVFLDCDAGILMFFNRVENKIHHIHTVKTTFTKPLVAGFQLHPGPLKLFGPEFF